MPTELVDSAGLVSRRALRVRALIALGAYSPLLRWYRKLRPRWWWERTSPMGRATRQYVDEHGLTVRRGPFAGLVYPRAAVGKGACLPAKLLGSYEAELGSVLEDAHGFDLFVDVGSADGYYSVGFKRRFPGTRVISYETDPAKRRIAARLAEANGADVESRGTADHDALAGLPPGRLLLMTDVEGYERDLLDPGVVPRLREATIIVETHSSARPDVVDVLCDRFARTHRVNAVHGRPRSVADYPELATWDEGAGRVAITEGRVGYPLWLVLTPVPPGDGAGSASSTRR